MFYIICYFLLIFRFFFRASDLVFSKWNDMFEEEIVYGELIRLRDLEGSEKGGEIFMLDNKIRLAVLLLELFVS